MGHGLGLDMTKSPATSYHIQTI